MYVYMPRKLLRPHWLQSRSLLRRSDLEVEADVEPIVGDWREHPHIVRAQKLFTTTKGQGQLVQNIGALCGDL